MASSNYIRGSLALKSPKFVVKSLSDLLYWAQYLVQDRIWAFCHALMFFLSFSCINSGHFRHASFESNLSNIDLFMSFGTIFWDVILGWYYNILGWKLSKQTSCWSKTVFFVSVENHNKFSSQNIVISSQNNVPKYRSGWHEKV